MAIDDIVPMAETIAVDAITGMTPTGVLTGIALAFQLTDGSRFQVALPLEQAETLGLETLVCVHGIRSGTLRVK